MPGTEENSPRHRSFYKRLFLPNSLTWKTPCTQNHKLEAHGTQLAQATQIEPKMNGCYLGNIYIYMYIFRRIQKVTIKIELTNSVNN